MATDSETSGGVQELITRIRDDGVKAASEEADRVLADAKRRAEKIVSVAKAEAEALRKKTREDVAAEKAAAEGALKLAARDTRLQLEQAVLGSFEGWVRRLVTNFVADPENTRALILVLAGRAVEEFVKDGDRRILANEILLADPDENPELMDRARGAVLGISGDMLRDGVELVPSSEVDAGAKVQLVGERLELDLTPETISRLLLRHMLPRFRGILEDQE